MVMALNPRVAVDGLFVGQVSLLAGDSRSSAIAKEPVRGRCRLQKNGLDGDTQADRRVHGGLGKALHQYPAEHYERLTAAFPEAQHLHPGGLGENLSTRGMTESDVCIGDIFRLGTACIQVSQPRSPCWKIDTRTGCEGVASYIGENSLAGWYFRVLEEGEFEVGDDMEHVERVADAVSLAEFWRVIRTQRPPIEALCRLAYASGLEEQWTAKLLQRVEWLRNNGQGSPT